MGELIYQVTGRENRSPWTHIQNRVGKAKMGGCRWGYHGNHLLYGLSVTIDSRYALGRPIFQLSASLDGYFIIYIKNGT